MSSTFGAAPPGALPDRQRGSGVLAGLSAAAITVPHALGLGLIAFAPLAGQLPVAALALWSAALPSAVLAIFAPRAGVVHAPTTVVALLFASVVITAMNMPPHLALSPYQVLAVCGATVGIGFGFQWLFGVLRLASLARFLPISVTHGFAAGVGLSMILSQVTGGFGAGSLGLDTGTLRHLLAALAVVGLAYALQKRWPRLPGMLPAVAGVAAFIAITGLAGFRPAATPEAFAWPPVPDWQSVPWLEVIQAKGFELVSLAMLMAIVNSIDILVFNQELDLDHGLRSEPNAALRRESLLGVLCAVCGMIPASTSPSRSRAALARAGPSPVVSPTHVAVLLVVAATGSLWLPLVPMACLSGALLLAGLTQVPAVLWSKEYANAAPATWSQGWLVAMVFAVSGGVGALVAGLVVATFVLLRASANTALRRSLLEGELHSRRLRRATADAWLAPRMRMVAVFELQGVMSFGVAAHLSEQVVSLLQPQHRWVILDASRVPAWDATALVRLNALVRDLSNNGKDVVVCGLDRHAARSVPAQVHQFADLDRALERAEDAILDERPPEARAAAARQEVLGELAEGLSAAGHDSLQEQLQAQSLQAGEQVFAAGDRARDMLIVQSGHVTLCTAWPPGKGLRLATVGRGMAFGEMAFLNGQPRSACAGAEHEPTTLMRLSRERFDQWAAEHPADALVFMSNLAQIGTRRLGATTRQLRAVLE
ncbi:MAG: SLC26A/SulP transporter family protein [Burkholderiales bacterium]|nr:SLC26A/SulP transporter family protein [Burkholderiales bacterium]